MSAVAFRPRYLLLPLLILLGGGVALLWREPTKGTSERELAEAPSPPEPQAGQDTPPVGRDAVETHRPRAESVSGESSGEDATTDSERNGSEEDSRKLPHPDGPRRAEQARILSWREQAKGAASRGDTTTLRRLLEERPEPESSADYADWWEGYASILACLEEPGANTTARGRKFVDEHRGSNLRRAVRKYCHL